jgi:acyl dehydratase
MSLPIQAAQEISPRACPEISRERLKAYSDFSLDPNLIHLDDEVAKKMGLPGAIAHGMLISGFLAERARRFVEDEAKLSGFRMSSLKTRFKSMNFPFEELTLSGVVKSCGDDGFTLELKAENPRGETTTTATAEYSKRPDSSKN